MTHNGWYDPEASALLDAHHQAEPDSEGDNCTVCWFALGFEGDGHTTSATETEIREWLAKG